MPISFLDAIYLFATFLGFVVGLIGIFFGLRKNPNNLVLGLIYIFLGYISFIIWLVITGYFLEFPRLYRTGNLVGLIFIPFTYLYVRGSTTGKHFRFSDLVHFLPALVFIVDFWPIFMLETSEKLELIRSEIVDPVLFTSYTQSRFFPDNFYNFARSSLLTAYWIASTVLVIRSFRRNAATSLNKEWFFWIGFFLFFESMGFLPFLLLFGIVDPRMSFQLLHFSIVILNVGTAFTLLFFPKILYGLDKESQMPELKNPLEHRKRTKEFNLSGDKINEIAEKIREALDDKEGFLKHGYAIHHLAEDTGVPIYLITQYINNVVNTTFPELINQKRIEACCRMIESGRYDHYTVEGLADLCGFSNRNSFSVAFKKFKGIAPSDFIRSQKKDR